MTDLESRIFLAIAKSTPTKQPAAVIAEIESTHVIVERARWERVRIAAQLANCDGCFEPGDLDPIRHDAAKSDI